jgi:hypothetical protein
MQPGIPDFPDADRFVLSLASLNESPKLADTGNECVDSQQIKPISILFRQAVDSSR